MKLIEALLAPLREDLFEDNEGDAGSDALHT
jgi:hypothetical protein